MIKYPREIKLGKLLVFFIFGIAMNLTAQEDGTKVNPVSTKPVATKVAKEKKTAIKKPSRAKITKNIYHDGEFEIVVSSYENNGVKTIIVTRNKKGTFHDRTEWVGRGVIPKELNWLMGKGSPAPSQEVKVKSYFGVIIVDSKNDEGGVDVTEVVKGSPAFEAGIRRGDRITSIASKQVKDVKGFANILTEKKAGEKIGCRYFRGKRLAIERVQLEKQPTKSGVNLKSIDGGEVFDFVAMKRAIEKPKTTATGGSGAKLMPKKSNMSLTGFNAVKTPGGWLNVSFSAPEVPITVVVFDKKGKEIFHQHMPWFKGNYKQLIKVKPGVEGPFSLVAAQGSSVYTQEIK